MKWEGRTFREPPIRGQDVMKGSEAAAGGADKKGKGKEPEAGGAAEGGGTGGDAPERLLPLLTNTCLALNHCVLDAPPQHKRF